ncbi:DUF6053 domain-containing protein [Lysobacter enzymogenes]|uniref:DUF6053 domain-containing protein n=1 Tax=Lysobacter enzymogenes TaxID=69 RepID=UPI003D18B8AC
MGGPSGPMLFAQSAANRKKSFGPEGPPTKEKARESRAFSHPAPELRSSRRTASPRTGRRRCRRPPESSGSTPRSSSPPRST